MVQASIGQNYVPIQPIVRKVSGITKIKLAITETAAIIVT